MASITGCWSGTLRKCVRITWRPPSGSTVRQGCPPSTSRTASVPSAGSRSSSKSTKKASSRTPTGFPATMSSMSSASGAGASWGRSRPAPTARRRWTSSGCSATPGSVPTSCMASCWTGSATWWPGSRSSSDWSRALTTSWGWNSRGGRLPVPPPTFASLAPGELRVGVGDGSTRMASGERRRRHGSFFTEITYLPLRIASSCPARRGKDSHEGDAAAEGKGGRGGGGERESPFLKKEKERKKKIIILMSIFKVFLLLVFQKRETDFSAAVLRYCLDQETEFLQQCPCHGFRATLLVLVQMGLLATCRQVGSALERKKSVVVRRGVGHIKLGLDLARPKSSEVALFRKQSPKFGSPLPKRHRLPLASDVGSSSCVFCTLFLLAIWVLSPLWSFLQNPRTLPGGK
ncbi:E3 ubiquitin ligase RNF121 isoform X1 [Anolis sagrei]|uniref:E3 ubiquitin ligase RNF121 isoform X1 n=1 Tax=Anolis sagrei TaxID=38937 RepID=UPI0035211C81